MVKGRLIGVVRPGKCSMQSPSLSSLAGLAVCPASCSQEQAEYMRLCLPLIDVRFHPHYGRRQNIAPCPISAKMYGPGRALQDRSSKTDERESCNNVSGL